MSEILPAMQVIKMYVWEIPFSQLVHIARKLEITKIRHSMILRSINLALYFVAPKVMSFVCLIIFLLSGGQLNAEIVFVSMALVAQIRDVITYLFPSGIAYGVEAYISIQRIEACYNSRVCLFIISICPFTFNRNFCLKKKSATTTRHCRRQLEITKIHLLQAGIQAKS